ncbi:hypothetical protein NSK_005019 [Nannochloropsis salina CCMP1776]|uniref:TraB domain-containing protein n=1 Tax=Nannochloropsis salina CCMP1776 TaxID=1027361 RepID=A0A4D9D1P9_9STRA|nr:hypothetical protein NSK_005019 [Nannochloropsis salina CCMP1776]|eukprot:TFJ83923.1 hypothetical protein NSK_005019 [Nannochloropsis salina CCMP1776]
MMPGPGGVGGRAGRSDHIASRLSRLSTFSFSVLAVRTWPFLAMLVSHLQPAQPFQRRPPPPPPSSSPPSFPSKPPLPFSSRLANQGNSASTRSSWPSSQVSSSPWESTTFLSTADPAPEDDGPFRLLFDQATDRFLFQTAVVDLQQPGQDGPRVRLIGSVHIAEPAYFKALEASCADCDVVLYEMITSEGNVLRDGSDARWPCKEQLGVELQATDALRRLASSHGLEPQLDNMHFFGKKNWYLSDIVREELCKLQRLRGESTLDAPAKGRLGHVFEMLEVFWNGFTSRGKVLPKFLFLRPGQAFSALPFRVLRLCMWLTPAPELQLLLLDWARQYPPAGGLSRVLRSMVGALVQGDFLTLRRLAFAQMLTSSQTAPSPEVLVQERDSKVVLDVEQALRTGAKDVGVLYGGLHLKDIEAKLRGHLNFTRVEGGMGKGAGGEETLKRGREAQAVQWHTAWTMQAFTRQRQALMTALCVALPALYLSVGGLDWSATFGGLAKDVSQHVATEATAAEAPTVGWQEVVLYMLRHMYIYYGLSRWVVEWEKQLFEMR